MKYLLDTCILLWALEDNRAKLGEFQEILVNPRNFVAVSVINYWEIAIKKSLGKLKAPDGLVEIVEESGFTWINLETSHIEALEKLPQLHNDPFDRLLVAQAKAEDFQLLTVDREVQAYFT